MPDNIHNKESLSASELIKGTFGAERLKQNLFLFDFILIMTGLIAATSASMMYAFTIGNSVMDARYLTTGSEV